MPAAAILSVTGEDLTVVLLGEKWRPAGMLLRIIGLRGILGVIEGSQGWLHLSIGRADRWRNWGIVTLAAQIVAVLGGLPFGPTGVAVACLLEGVLIAIPSINYAGRPIGVGSALVIRAVRPQLIGAVSAAVAGTWLQVTILAHCSSLVRILLPAVFSACVYLVVVVGLFRRVDPLRIASSVLRDRLRSNA